MKKKINKIHILLAVYIMFITIELFFFVPYSKVVIYRSTQNVPHTEIIGSGYASIFTIKDADNIYRDNATGKISDSAQRSVNIIITTLIFALIYFIFIFKKDKTDSKKTSLQLQQVKEELASKNNELDYYKIFHNSILEYSFLKHIVDSKDFPKLDIVSLCFASDEEIAKTEKKYAEDVYKTIIQKLSSYAKSEATNNNMLPLEIPTIDVNALAFADDETVMREQKKYAEKLYKYIEEKYKTEHNCK